MNVYRRYFKITEGSLVDFAREGLKNNEEAKKSYQEILKDIGAEVGYFHQDNKLVAFTFEGEVDTTLYKKVKGYGYYPKKTSKAGKELVKRLEAVPTFKDDMVLEQLPKKPEIIFGDMRLHFPNCVIIPSPTPVIFITVPWYDEDPAELEKYKEYKDTRNSTMEALLWEPTTEMEEVKEWEVHKEIDAWNSRAI